MPQENEELMAGATGATPSTTPKRKLGISKDTVGGSTVPIPAPYKLDKPNEQFTTGYHFPIAKLVAVSYIADKAMKQNGVDVTKPVLSFIFKDDKNRQYQHIEFPVDEDDAKFESKVEWLNQRVKHIWDETIGDKMFPQEGLGANAETFAELFKDIADKFNAVKTGEGEQARVVYAQTLLYIKLTYNKDRVQFPLFPNFVQRAKIADKVVPVVTLTITPSRDKVEPPASTSAPALGYAGGTDNTFGGGANFAAGAEFPDV